MRKLSKKLLLSILSVALVFIALGTTTFAWFSMNRTVTATGMQIKAKSNSTYLLIGENTLTTADAIQAQTGTDLTTEALTVSDAESAVYPSKAFGVADATKDPASSADFTPTAITTKALAEVQGNWYTANSTDPTVWGGGEKTKDVTQLTSTNFGSFVIKRQVNLTLADGSTKANNLTVKPTFAIKDTYAKTSDIALADGKTYYTTSDNGVTFTAVTSPSVENISNYYEKATDISAVKVLIVTDNNVVVVLDADDSGNVIDLYNGTSTQNLDITDTTVHHVDIYIYYDGTEEIVNTNDALDLSACTIDLEFGVSVNE